VVALTAFQTAIAVAKICEDNINIMKADNKGYNMYNIG
jgi:hypothetical protein